MILTSRQIWWYKKSLFKGIQIISSNFQATVNIFQPRDLAKSPYDHLLLAYLHSRIDEKLLTLSTLSCSLLQVRLWCDLIWSLPQVVPMAPSIPSCWANFSKLLRMKLFVFLFYIQRENLKNNNNNNNNLFCKF